MAGKLGKNILVDPQAVSITVLDGRAKSGSKMIGCEDWPQYPHVSVDCKVNLIALRDWWI